MTGRRDVAMALENKTKIKSVQHMLVMSVFHKKIILWLRIFTFFTLTQSLLFFSVRKHLYAQNEIFERSDACSVTL
jgi:hypothetical protein